MWNRHSRKADPEGYRAYVEQERLEKLRKLNATDLISVCERGDSEGVNRLIEEGQDLDIIERALITASDAGNLEIVRILLSDDRVDPTIEDNYLLHLAIGSGDSEFIRLLLADDRVDPSTNNNYAILEASLDGNIEVLRLLLADRRVDPGGDNLAIQKASKYGHTEIVRLLLADKRVDPSANNNWAIRMASENGHTEVVRLLLTDERVDPFKKNNMFNLLRNYPLLILCILSTKRKPDLNEPQIRDILIYYYNELGLEDLEIFLKEKGLSEILRTSLEIVYENLHIKYRELERILN